MSSEPGNLIASDLSDPASSISPNKNKENESGSRTKFTFKDGSLLIKRLFSPRSKPKVPLDTSYSFNDEPDKRLEDDDVVNKVLEEKRINSISDETDEGNIKDNNGHIGQECLENQVFQWMDFKCTSYFDFVMKRLRDKLSLREDKSKSQQFQDEKKFDFYMKHLRNLKVTEGGIINLEGWKMSEIEGFMSMVYDGFSVGDLIKNSARKTTNDIDTFLDITGLKKPLFSHIRREICRTIEENKNECTVDIYLPNAFHGMSDFKKSIDDIKKSKDGLVDKILSIRISLASYDEEDLIDSNILKSLFDRDLTLSALEDAFPGADIKKLKQIAINLGFDELSDLTPGESELLKEYADTSVDIRSITEDFPFRSLIYVEKKLVDIDHNRRRTVFESKVDELVYMAQWYSSEKFDSTRTTRSRDKVLAEKRLQVQTKMKSRRKLDDYEIAARKARATRMHEMKKERQKKRAEISELRKRGRRAKTRGRKKLTLADQLNMESKYFQSVTGDGSIIRSGEKRKRKPHVPITVDSDSRPLKRRTASRSISEETDSDSTPQIKKEGEAISLVPIRVMKETPYYPESIQTDTQIPLHKRQLFTFLEKEGPSVPSIDFCKELTCMLSSRENIAYEDKTAYDIISNHLKRYTSLPPTFPPLLVNQDGTLVLNKMNEIKIRFLLHPEHIELYILAVPKSDELDPVEEIKKVFQIHYGLYFSHSAFIKEEILGFCKSLDSSVLEDDFSQFMNIIDTWNSLMIELCPRDVKYINQDINASVRSYVIRPITRVLRVDHYYNEILFHPSDKPKKRGRPRKHPIKSNVMVRELKIESCKKPSKMDIASLLNSVDSTMSEKYVSTDSTSQRPHAYNGDFVMRLKRMQKISRYTLQQIMLRVYARVVSVNSRKLRSYKAFTAEVYGELLPSFISEVLEKIDIRPNQKFYDLGSGVGNAVFQAALEFGAISGGCELMKHASKLTRLQELLMQKHLATFGIQRLNLDFALDQSFVDNDRVRQAVVGCDVLLVNNYLFDGKLNASVGRLLYGLKPGTVIISLRNFILKRYKASNDKTIFDYLKVEKHEMTELFSVSWTANKVPYYISRVQRDICKEYLN